MHKKLCVVLLGLSGTFGTNGVRAAIVEIALTGDTTRLTSTTTNITDDINQTVQRLTLLNAGTGTNVLPGINVAVGDTIRGSLRLNGPVTFGLDINATSYQTQLYFSLWALGTTANYLGYSESITFLNNGTPLATPTGISANFAGTGNLGLLLGVSSSYSTLPVPTAPFTFTEIAFSASINQILDRRFQNLTSATLAAGTPTLTIETTSHLPPPAVPVPAAAWLLLSGLGAFSLVARKRTRWNARDAVAPMSDKAIVTDSIARPAARLV